MRKMASAMALAVGLCLPGLVSAATFSSTYSVSGAMSAPGLKLRATPGTGAFAKELEVGESTTFHLFKIWTNNLWVRHGGNKLQTPVSVDFDFLAPRTGGTINGTAAADVSGFGLLHNGRLTWDAPLVLNFGANDTGQITLALSDVNFKRRYLRSGLKYGGRVKATLTYDAASVSPSVNPAPVSPAPVPLPAGLPLLLGGLGMIGVVSRRRRARA